MLFGWLTLIVYVIAMLTRDTIGDCKSNIPDSSISTAKFDISFSSAIDYPLYAVVTAWAVATPASRLLERYEVDVSSIEKTKFAATIRRIDSSSGWASPLTLCWKIEDVDPPSESVFLGKQVIIYPTRPMETITTIISDYDSSRKILTITGRTMYMSTVQKEILRYAMKQITTTSSLIDVNISVTCLVFDQPGIIITGIRIFDLSAKEILGLEKNSVIFKAPAFCETITGGSCSNSVTPASDGKSSGADGIPGANARKGISGPLVSILSTIIEGSFNFRIQGSNGLNGQYGGSGKLGMTPTSVPGQPSCGGNCGGASMTGPHAYFKGNKGYAGGNGGSGAKSGNGGDGGDSGKFSLTIRSKGYRDVMSGKRQVFVSLTCMSGTPGEPGRPGHGAIGGIGGKGSCGKECDKEAFNCKQYSHCSGTYMGNNGDIGNPGKNSLIFDDLPSHGMHGVVIGNCIISYV